MNNSLRFIQRLLYKLKRQYGFPIDLYKANQTVNNLQTGRVQVTRVKYSIDRVVVLPAVLQSKFNYNHSYILADKAFSYGATYDLSERTIIVDYTDLPPDVNIELEDYIIYDQHRYEVKKIGTLEHQLGVMVVMKEAKGSVPFELLSESVSQQFRISQTVVES